jgi:Ubiquitin carboxyl-terminal hydrolase
MLDKLHEDLNRVLKKPYIEEKDYKQGEPEDPYFWQIVKNFKARNDSFISDLFYGFFRTATTCPTCGFLSLKFEPFNMLTVPVRGLNDSKTFAYYFQGEYSMYDLIKFNTTASPDMTLADIKANTAKQLSIDADCLAFYSFDKQTTIYSALDESTQITEIGKVTQFFSFLIYHKSGLFVGDDMVTLFFDIDGANPADTVGIKKVVKVPRKCPASKLYKYFYGVLKKLFPYYVDPFESHFKPQASGRLFDLFLKKSIIHYDIGLEEDEPIVEISEGDTILVDILISAMKRQSALRDLRIEDQKLGLKHASIYDCLEAFTEHEELDSDNKWFCAKCKDHKKAKVQLTLKTLPKILVIHLKRFKKTQTGVSKFHETIEFPLEGLDLAKFTTDPDLPDNKVVYNLFATINHYGTLYKGHYKAFAQTVNNKIWCEFDDESVTSIKHADAFLNDKPYILFYRRSS